MVPTLFGNPYTPAFERPLGGKKVLRIIVRIEPQTELPESLDTQLREFEMRLMLMETLSAASGTALALLAGPAVLVTMDRFWETPILARSLLTGTSVLVIGLLLRRWSYFWIWSPRSTADLAKLLQNYFGSLGDRLQSAVELSAATELPAGTSASLTHAALTQVASESLEHDFNEAVPAEEARVRSIWAASLACLLVIGYILAPDMLLNTAARWAMPWSHLPRMTFATIEELPSELVVAHGEPVEFVCRLKPESKWRPETIHVRLDSTKKISANYDYDGAHIQIPAVTRDTMAFFRAGDSTRSMKIIPVLRPELKELEAIATPPAYLGLEKKTVPLTAAQNTFVAGSQISIVGVASRPLSEAHLFVFAKENSPSDSHDAPEPLKQLRAEIHGPVFTIEEGPADDLSGNVSLEWRDQDGLRCIKPFPIRISTFPDMPPHVELSGVADGATILEDKVLALKVSASDDYGVKETWVEWTAKPDVSGVEKPTQQGASSRSKGTPDKKTHAHSVSFSSTLEKIPADTIVTLVGCSTDFLPTRTVSKSRPISIRVMSKSTHAELTRSKIDQLQQQLADETRNEQRVLEETEATSRILKDSSKEQIAEDINRLETAQNAGTKNLQKLISELQSAVKDALQNSSVPESTIADLQKIIDQLEKDATPLMQQASQGIQSAKQDSSKAAESLEKAAEAQRKAVDAMSKANPAISAGNAALRTRNFHTRLVSAARSQKTLCSELAALPASGVGATLGALSEFEREVLKKHAGKQKELAQSIGTMAYELEAFLEQAPIIEYQTVHDEITSKDAVAAIVDIAENVKINLRYRASERAEEWAKQFTVWADLIRGSKSNSKEKSDGDPSQSDGEDADKDDPDLANYIVALTRVAQQQDELRAQTELLEANRDKDSYQSDVADLLTKQEDLRVQLEKLRDQATIDGSLLASIGSVEKVPAQKFSRFYPATSQSESLMRSVVDHLVDQRTDAPVVGKQTVIIELLSPPGDDDSNPSKGSPSEKKLQQMMRKLLTPPKPSSGNDAHMEAESLESARAVGSSLATKLQTRQIEKGSASDVSEWPSEFRAVMQSYFQQADSIR